MRVEGAQAPEADLTRALYERHATQIFRYCLHQLGSREEAEDAVQSTFLNAFRGLKRGVVPELETAWLFKIALNVCLSRRRSTWRRGRIESPADFGVVEETAPAPSRRADELIGLQDALEGMPDQQRRAILLREWQGLSYREIGEELELSQAAVETLIFRARRALATGLEQPVARKRRRRLGAAAAGNLVSSLQGVLFGGGAAVKVAATVAVVSAGAVVATAPVQRHLRPPAHHAARVAQRPAAPSASATAPAAPATPPRVERRAAPARAPVRAPAAARRRPAHRYAARPLRRPARSGRAPLVARAAPAAASPHGKGRALGRVRRGVVRRAVVRAASQPLPPAAAPHVAHGKAATPGDRGRQPGRTPPARLRQLAAAPPPPAAPADPPADPGTHGQGEPKGRTK